MSKISNRLARISKNPSILNISFSPSELSRLINHKEPSLLPLLIKFKQLNAIKQLYNSNPEHYNLIDVLDTLPASDAQFSRSLISIILRDKLSALEYNRLMSSLEKKPILLEILFESDRIIELMTLQSFENNRYFWLFDLIDSIKPSLFLSTSKLKGYSYAASILNFFGLSCKDSIDTHLIEKDLVSQHITSKNDLLVLLAQIRSILMLPKQVSERAVILAITALETLIAKFPNTSKEIQVFIFEELLEAMFHCKGILECSKAFKDSICQTAAENPSLFSSIRINQIFRLEKDIRMDLPVRKFKLSTTEEIPEYLFPQLNFESFEKLFNRNALFLLTAGKTFKNDERLSLEVESLFSKEYFGWRLVEFWHRKQAEMKSLKEKESEDLDDEN